MSDHTHGVARRSRMGAAAGVGVLGAGAAIGARQLLAPEPSAPTIAAPEAPTALGSSVIPFHGEHQAGIATSLQAHANFIALDLAGPGRQDAQRLMRLLSDDAARMTQGEIALADGEAELSEVPANLSVTFGFGPGFLSKLGLGGPAWLRQLPAFGIDRLQSEWSEGDLLLRVAGDDPLTVAHTSRMLVKDARPFGTVRWAQQGFRRAAGSTKAGATHRNLFGQVDGTVNPVPGTAKFDQLVWSTDSGWMQGGTSMVIRRIHMDLDRWDQLDRSGREQAVGRKLSNGAPLTGVNETDEPDFAKKLRSGFTVIPDFSHMRRARGDDPSVGAQILRQPYTYHDSPAGGSVSDSGLIFVSCQADPVAQFVPMQERLDKLDILNTWTTPIGSAVFAIPPGCQPGSYIGQALLES